MELTLDKRSWGLRLAFFVGVPVLLSLPLGLFKAGFAQYLPLQIAIVFWTVSWFATWWLSELCLRAWHRFLRPWSVPLLPEIVLAVVTSMALSSLYFPYWMEFAARFAQGLPPDYFGYRMQTTAVDRWAALVRSGVPGVIAWTALRTLYAMLPPARQWTMRQPAPEREVAAQPSGKPQSVEPPANSRFGRELAGQGVRDLTEIVALQASDHYVSVFLRDGRQLLILSRFADAINALGALDGLRIHRSFWVRREAIASVEHEGTALVAQLDTGLRCPVSTKYQGLLEHMVARN